MSITVKAIFRGRETKEREFDEMKMSGCHDNDNIERRIAKNGGTQLRKLKKCSQRERKKEGKKEENGKKMRIRRKWDEN